MTHEYTVNTNENKFTTSFIKQAGPSYESL